MSDDGSRILLIISESGSDLGDIHGLDVATKQFFPDLFKAVTIKVGVLISLRVEFLPSDPTQIAEFGPVMDATEFSALLEIDAYHHIQSGINYPTQLITASFKDFLVPPYMPAKFAAKIQAANSSKDHVILAVDFEGGYFGSNDPDEVFVQMAKDWASLLWQTGQPYFQPVK